MPPSKRVRRTANAADEPAGPPASAADAPTPAASSAASPPAPSTGEDTGSKEGKKESVAHWSPIELAVRALPPLCVVQYCTADTVLLICLSVHRPPLVRGATRASGGVRVPRHTASTRRPSRTRTSSIKEMRLPVGREVCDHLDVPLVRSPSERVRVILRASLRALLVIGIQEEACVITFLAYWTRRPLLLHYREVTCRA